MKKILLIIAVLLIALSQVAWSFKTHKDTTRAAYDALSEEIKAEFLLTMNIALFPENCEENDGAEDEGKPQCTGSTVYYNLPRMSTVPDLYRRAKKDNNYTDDSNPYRMPDDFSPYLEKKDRKEFVELPEDHDLKNAKKYADKYAEAAGRAYRGVKKEGLPVNLKAALYFMGVASHLYEDACSAVHIIDKDYKWHKEFEDDPKKLSKEEPLYITVEPLSLDTENIKLSIAEEQAEDEYDKWYDARGKERKNTSTRRELFATELSRAATIINIMFNEVTAEDLLDLDIDNEASYKKVNTLGDSQYQLAHAVTKDKAITIKVKASAGKNKRFSVNIFC